jgi:hypothetical protein
MLAEKSFASTANQRLKQFLCKENSATTNADSCSKECIETMDKQQIAKSATENLSKPKTLIQCVQTDVV